MKMFPDDDFFKKDITPLFLFKPTSPVKLRSTEEEIKDGKFSYLVVVIKTETKTTREKVTGVNFMYWGLGEDKGVCDSEQMAFSQSERGQRNYFISAPLRAFKKHEIDILKLEGTPLSLKKLQKYTDLWMKK